MKKRITYSSVAAVLLAAVFLAAGLITADHRSPEPSAAPTDVLTEATTAVPTAEATPTPTEPPEITPPAPYSADAASGSDVHLVPVLPASDSDTVVLSPPPASDSDIG